MNLNKENYTIDEFLGGLFKLKQPKKGFRAGTDSILLAASIHLKKEHSLIELGCGVGAVLLSLNHRFPNNTLSGIEFDNVSYSYALENLRKLRETIEILNADITEISKKSTYKSFQQRFDQAVMNPPFFQNSHKKQQSVSRENARSFSNQSHELALWFKAANFLLRDQGLLTIVYSTASLSSVITIAETAHFGGFKLFPIWSKPGNNSKRIIIQMQKNSKKPTVLKPGLILYNADNTHTPEAISILNNGNQLNIND
ncbi:MAG: hypothetical protein CMM87_03470 [Rickettsiales bacterium]|nr:hypothetical protein [Rickettsiales bacterium]|tara:strand:+ start:15424 stop:16191 length:768 start_codon:yes stop_codon:yes gene_type:complete